MGEWGSDLSIPDQVKTLKAQVTFGLYFSSVLETFTTVHKWNTKDILLENTKIQYVGAYL